MTNIVSRQFGAWVINSVKIYNMKSILGLSKRLYVRLSLAFLILLLFQSLVLSYVWQYGNKAYSQEITQKLNESIAMYITQQQQLISKGVVNVSELELLANRAMVINPSVEVYLLSKTGVVISNQDDVELEHQAIDLAAINEFLSPTRTLPILAQDPKVKNELKPFSVSPIMEAGALAGYLYVVLGGAVEQGIIDSIKSSNILSLGIAALFGSILLTIIFSVIIFYFMTHRLRKLSVQVKNFQLTNFEDFSSIIKHKKPSYFGHQDEIDQLSFSVLAMVQHMKEQFEKIKDVDQQRREFIANISHDLKTPLATIQGYVETIIIKEEQKPLTAEKRKEYLVIALKQSNKLSGLIDQLFELAKLESGSMTPSLEVFSLKELLHDSLQDARWSAQGKNISFKMDIDDQDYKVKADIALIQRVVQNLLDNAIKYSPENSIIRLHINNLDDKTSLHVIDEGKGILAEDIPYLFERYYRCQQQRHSSKLGSGLGLAIVKKICDLHKSSISVSSQLGKGSEFKFALTRV
jgi:signal transduction histidine kinase